MLLFLLGVSCVPPVPQGPLEGVVRPSAVEEVRIESRESALDGRAFGETGAYEKISGTITFAWSERDHPFVFATVVDAGLAVRDEDGRVVAVADFMLLQPQDPGKSCGTALIEVSNRGGKAALGYFNRARYAADPSTEEHFGDGWLMRQGLTVAWVGWQWDVPEEPGRLRLRVPVATHEDGSAISGPVRADWVVDQPTPVLALGHRNHVAYPAADAQHADDVLTARDGRNAPREIVPREKWRFARLDEDGAVVADRRHVWREGGFEAGRIYELVYRAEDPRVAGLGLAAMREVGLALKAGVLQPGFSGEAGDAADPRPGRPESVLPSPAIHEVERTVAVGISQTGRFLRHFLYEGWNDLVGHVRREGSDRDSASGPAYRAVPFDGLLVHTAGAGRGSFNHRFAQPSRDAHRYSAFFYPTDLFPFAGRPLRDPVSGRRDGLLRDAGGVPRAPGAKIFFTNTGYEYWGRAASLLHTSLDASVDVEPLDQVRIYHLRSTQHFPVAFRAHRFEDDLDAPPSWRGNPVDFLVTERALLRALLDWVEEGTEPPPSAYPRIAANELVGLDRYGDAWGGVPGVPAPLVMHEAHAVDYGHGMNGGHHVIAKQPPQLGPAYETLVPAVDGTGNELSGVPSMETLVPLASYLPWHLRSGLAGGNGELTDFWGTFVPLPRTQEERLRWRDPRISIAARYGSRARYLEIVDEVGRMLVADRFLLEEDLPRVRARAEATWDWWVGDRLPAADRD